MSRDTLAPPLMRMSGGRCYRVNLVHDDFGAVGQQQAKVAIQSAEKGYQEQDLYNEDYDDEGEGDCDIEELDNGFFKLSLQVPIAFYGGIIGFKGSTKRRIESETNTEIFVPRTRDGGGNKEKDKITIKAKSKDKVLAAKRQINILIFSLRKRMPKTHFICVAFRDTPVQEKFIEFQKKVLALELPGIDELFFQSDNCIHLTIAACVLIDETEREKANQLLQSSREFMKDLKTPFEVKVKNLEIMNDDPSAVQVLYATIDAPELQKYADRLLKLFEKANFAFDKFEREQVKMHMTVMNTRYGKTTDKNGKRNFDAREILKRFGNFDFGTATCNEILICVLHSNPDRKNFYKVSASLKL